MIASRASFVFSKTSSLPSGRLAVAADVLLLEVVRRDIFLAFLHRAHAATSFVLLRRAFAGHPFALHEHTVAASSSRRRFALAIAAAFTTRGGVRVGHVAVHLRGKGMIVSLEVVETDVPTQLRRSVFAMPSVVGALLSKRVVRCERRSSTMHTVLFAVETDGRR